MQVESWWCLSGEAGNRVNANGRNPTFTHSNQHQPDDTTLLEFSSERDVIVKSSLN